MLASVSGLATARVKSVSFRGNAIAALTTSLNAAPSPVVMTLKNHVFFPASVTVPAGEKISIQLINQDAATEEFDSHDLKVEKLVTPGGHATFTIGPLQPGDYSFMGEFHPKTAQGKITVIVAR